MNIRFGTIDRFFVFFYKIMGITLLTLIALAVVFYACLFVFYTFDRNWAVPVRFSPAQQPILTFQTQIATLESSLATQKIELETAEQTKAALTLSTERMEDLLKRSEKAIAAEAKQMSKVGRELGAANNKGKGTASVIRDLMATINQELETGLITKEEAASRVTAAIQREEALSRLQRGADTLLGGGSSLAALSSVDRNAQMQVNLTQMKIQLVTAKSTAEALKKRISETERLLTLAKTSPYYQALHKTVDVLFLPYDNLRHASIGAPVYNCYLQIIGCFQVGEVKEIFEAEQFARHPFFKSDAKGQYVSVQITSEAAQSMVLFVGSKPLFI